MCGIVNFRVFPYQFLSTKSSKLLCETLITGILLETRVREQRCIGYVYSTMSAWLQGDLIPGGVFLLWDLYVCGDWIFRPKLLLGAIPVRTFSFRTSARTRIRTYRDTPT